MKIVRAIGNTFVLIGFILINRRLLASLAVAVITVLAFMFGRDSRIFFWAISIIDGYLIWVLFAAAVRSDAKNKNIGWNRDLNRDKFKYWCAILFPNRAVGFLMVILFFFTLVLSFGGIYRTAGTGDFNYPSIQAVRTNSTNHVAETNLVSLPITNNANACYFSLVTISTVGFGDYTPITPWAKWLVMWEIASGFLLLVTTISFLVSRMADFESKPKEKTNKEEIKSEIKSRIQLILKTANRRKHRDLTAEEIAKLEELIAKLELKD